MHVDAQDKVKEHEYIEGLHEKGKTIVAMECLWPQLHTFPTFMHLAVPTSDVRDVDALKRKRDQGMGGRIAERLNATLEDQLYALEAKIHEQTTDLTSKIADATESRLRSLETKLDRFENTLAAELHEIKQALASR